MIGKILTLLQDLGVDPDIIPFLVIAIFVFGTGCFVFMIGRGIFWLYRGLRTDRDVTIKIILKNIRAIIILMSFITAFVVVSKIIGFIIGSSPFWEIGAFLIVTGGLVYVSRRLTNRIGDRQTFCTGVLRIF